MRAINLRAGFRLLSGFGKLGAHPIAGREGIQIIKGEMIDMAKARLSIAVVLVLVLGLGACGATKQTPLHDASYLGDLREVKRLLEGGTDVNAATKNGNTPLHWAANMGKTEVVKLLLASGAAVDAKDSSGFNALIFAAMEGKTEVVNLLLANGAKVTSVTKLEIRRFIGLPTWARPRL